MNFKRIRIRNLIQKLENEGLDKKKLKLTINNLKDSNQTIESLVTTAISKLGENIVVSRFSRFQLGEKK